MPFPGGQGQLDASAPRMRFGLDGRLPVKRLGQQRAFPGRGHDVASVRERHDIVGVIRAPRALDAVRIQIGEMIGVGKLVSISQDAAQKVGRPQRVGMLGFEHP